MELKYTIIFLIVKIFSLTELLSAYIIQTPLGAVRGTVEKSINGSEFYSFKGTYYILSLKTNSTNFFKNLFFNF